MKWSFKINKIKNKKINYLCAWIFRSFSVRLNVSLTWYLAIPFHFPEFCCIMWFRIAGNYTKNNKFKKKKNQRWAFGGRLGVLRKRVPALKWALLWAVLGLWWPDEPGSAAAPGERAADRSTLPSGSLEAGAQRDSGFSAPSWEGKAALRRMHFDKESNRKGMRYV